jgi:crossover junction endodeoxyribonuclease RuvC
MKVLAIDPGYDRLGVAVLESGTNKNILLYSTCITTKRGDDFSDRLVIIGTALRELMVTHTPDCVALEELFFNKNVKTAILVAEARGVILFMAREAGRPIYEFSPSTIKLATTGYGSSDKTAVIAMVKRLVDNVPETALDDEYDAIAVGVTCLAQHGRGR